MNNYNVHQVGDQNNVHLLSLCWWNLQFTKSILVCLLEPTGCHEQWSRTKGFVDYIKVLLREYCTTPWWPTISLSSDFAGQLKRPKQVWWARPISPLLLCCVDIWQLELVILAIPTYWHWDWNVLSTLCWGLVEGQPVYSGPGRRTSPNISVVISGGSLAIAAIKRQLEELVTRKYTSWWRGSPAYGPTPSPDALLTTRAHPHMVLYKGLYSSCTVWYVWYVCCSVLKVLE